MAHRLLATVGLVGWWLAVERLGGFVITLRLVRALGLAGVIIRVVCGVVTV